MRRIALLGLLTAWPLAAAAPGWLHPRRYAARQHRAGSRVVGCRVLRPACQRPSGRQQYHRMERHHVPGACTASGNADRPASAARRRQHDPGQAQRLTSRRDGNAFFVTLTAPQRVGAAEHGHGVLPRPAGRGGPPPWDGGFIWQHDSLGNRWIATANQGLGAFIGVVARQGHASRRAGFRQRIAITVPDPMIDVSNGRLRHHHAPRRQHHDVRMVRERTDQQLRCGRSTPGRTRISAQIYHGEDGPR